MKNTKFDQGWFLNQPQEDITEISPAKCMLHAAGIIMAAVIGFVLVVVGLSL